jgi:alpha-tubulin suppressor-like RCC1 family protein
MAGEGRRWALLFALLVGVVSCRTPRSQLLVVITLDPTAPPADRIDSVNVVVRSSAQSDPPRLDRLFEIGQSAGQVTFPFSFGVYPENEAVERRVDIVVDACGAQGCIGREGGTRAPIVSVHANVGFVRGETRVLTLRLSQRCAMASCAASQSCDPDTGLCVDASVDASRLPRADADGGAASDGPSAIEVAQIAAGGGITCFRMTDRTVRCAGGSDSLLFYSNFVGPPTTSTPTVVPGLEDAIDIAAGFGHACAILRDRTVRCWGGNSFGQLGNGRVESAGRAEPDEVVGLHDVAQLALGGYFSCARLVDGSVKCWGADVEGELGDGQQSVVPVTTPRLVRGLSADVVEITAGGFHACARLASGSVMCWGAHLSAAIGDGMPGSPLASPTGPVRALGLDAVTQITAGAISTCARHADGHVSCWGSNNFGQAARATGNTLTATPVPGIAHAAEVRAGAYHVCARIDDGTVWCWGRNDRGQLGHGDRGTHIEPVAVEGVADAIALAVGSEHTCVQRANHSVLCWGDDSTGQLASGRPLVRTTPVDAIDLDEADRLSAGALHTCALRGGSAWCWGLSVGIGRVEGVTPPLQDGVRTSSAVATPVTHLAPQPDQLAVGNDFVCAHMADGTVRCWGHNNLGQLGTGTLDSITPAEIDGLTDTAEVRVGLTFGCARGRDGTVRCWGDNSSGQLGVSRVTQQRNHPDLVPGLSNVTHLAAHDTHACARLANGTVSCWGSNDVGEAGNGGQNADSPSTVVGLADAIDVGTVSLASFARTADGGMDAWGWNGVGLLLADPSDILLFTAHHSRLRDVAEFDTSAQSACAISTAGDLSCWGVNSFGEVGDGTHYVSNAPHAIALGSGARASHVSMSDVTSCAIADGDVYCWGENSLGGVGDGTGRPRLLPTRVGDPLTDVRSVSSAVEQSCALTNTREAYCWGTNLYGSLGHEERGDPSTAVDVIGLGSAHITNVSTGTTATCGIDTYHRIWCWGSNDVGELGIGSAEPQSGAVQVLLPTGAPEMSAVSVGTRYACSLGGGQVYCWGANDYGQLADGTDVARSTPVRVPTIDDAVEIITMASTACARRSRDNSVWCWGGNALGELGNGSILPSTDPVPVHDLSHVTQLTAGDSFACALHDGGQVACWGDNRASQLGPVVARWPPYSETVVDLRLSGVQRIVAGAYSVCAVFASGSTQCWGDNQFNQLAAGAPYPLIDPVDVPQASNVDDLALGFGHMCVIRAGQVECWGRNDEHELGDASNTLTATRHPVVGFGPSDAVAIDSSYTHTCAIHAAGGVSCWGGNETGALGSGTRAASLRPVRVEGLHRDGFGVASVSAGAGYTCARLGNGTARCWGSNFDGQLGETLGPDRLVPSASTSAGNLPDLAVISSGASHTCAVTTQHVAYCWGSNGSGQLGYPTPGDQPVPIEIPRTRIVDIAAGGEHTCAVLEDGSVICWGANRQGQCGVAPSATESFVTVPGVTGVEHVVAGGIHTCAWSAAAGVFCWGQGHGPEHIDELVDVSRVATAADVTCNLDPMRFIACTPTGRDHTCALAAGRVWCWGTNAHGELGDGTFTDATRPLLVNALTDVQDIGVGGRHTCARRNDGHVVCWGSDSYGQLGTRVESWRSAPAAVTELP